MNKYFNISRKEIKPIKFDIMNFDDIKKLSDTRISNISLYDYPKPKKGGLTDPLMGLKYYRKNIQLKCTIF
jgi:DNA-directed RNA polymerase beta' subunit